MMAIMKLRGLGTRGLNTDIPDQDLTPDQWSDGLNVRFSNGKATRIGGCHQVDHLSTFTSGTETPYDLVERNVFDGSYFFATNTNVYCVHQDVSTGDLIRTNVTPADANGVVVPDRTDKVRAYTVDSANRWSSAVIASHVVFHAPGYDPITQEVATDYTKPFITLPGWAEPSKTSGSNAGIKWDCARIRAYKSYLVALNMTEVKNNTTLEIKNRVRWSDASQDGGIPSNWREDDDSSDGGFNDLVDSASGIIDGFPLQDDFIIYTNAESYRMSFTGGAEIFQFSKLFADEGMMTVDCAVDVGGQHIVLGKTDVYMHDGRQKKSIVDGRIKERLFAEITSENPDAARLFHHKAAKEVWVCYPYLTGRTQAYGLNRAAIYNYQYDTWTFAELPDVYSAVTNVMRGLTDDAQWNQQDDSFNDIQRQWEPSLAKGLGTNFIMTSRDKTIYFMDDGLDWQRVGHAQETRPAWLNRKAIDMDEMSDNIHQSKFWQWIDPQAKGSGTLTFTTGGQWVIGGAEYMEPSQDFHIGTDYRLDVLSNYRYHTLRVDFLAQGMIEFTGVDIHYQLEGYV